jgi:AraC-like DNA-binding protein
MPHGWLQTQPAPKGILYPRAGEARFAVSRHPPTPELADHVAWYWIVRWDLRGGDTYTQHTLPHPCVHLVAERGRSAVFGVMTGRFTRVLQGQGRVFGVKFQPAGFRPFLGSPVAALTDRQAAVAEVFGQPGDALVERLLSVDDEPTMVAAADAFVRARLPDPDPSVPLVNRIVGRIMDDRDITKVDDVVERTGIGKRTLQRLFAGYVGATPKWVIRRYRLHEAAERLAAGDDVDLAGLAVDLGWFDQAHFAHEFRAIVGRAPAEYARGAARAD